MISIRFVSHLAVTLLSIVAAGHLTGHRITLVGATPVLSRTAPTPLGFGAPSLKGTYPLGVICHTEPELRLSRVTVTDTKTICDLTFQAERIGNEAPTSWIHTAAPGKLMAFYIADPNTRREYKLLNVEGIALEPAKQFLDRGKPVHFTLTFERIPDQMTKFHLIEGKAQEVDENHRPVVTWTFMNVQLR